jgi:hypothetical protein
LTGWVHSDAGSQYLSIRYTARLADVGIDPSVGSVGDSYDDSLADGAGPHVGVIPGFQRSDRRKGLTRVLKLDTHGEDVPLGYSDNSTCTASTPGPRMAC